MKTADRIALARRRAIRLMQLWPTTDNETIARELGITIHGVASMSRRIGLPKRKFCHRPREYWLNEMPSHDEARYSRSADKRRCNADDEKEDRAVRSIIEAHKARRVW